MGSRQTLKMSADGRAWACSFSKTFCRIPASAAPPASSEGRSAVVKLCYRKQAATTRSFYFAAAATRSVGSRFATDDFEDLSACSPRNCLSRQEPRGERGQPLLGSSRGPTAGPSACYFQSPTTSSYRQQLRRLADDDERTGNRSAPPRELLLTDRREKTTLRAAAWRNMN